VFEFSGAKLNNGLKIGLKTMLFEEEIIFSPDLIYVRTLQRRKA